MSEDVPEYLSEIQRRAGISPEPAARGVRPEDIANLQDHALHLHKLAQEHPELAKALEYLAQDIKRIATRLETGI